MEGKKKVEQLIQAENDAIRSFFEPAPKKKKSRKKKSELKLAVPADEPTPFVKEMEESGAGHVVNPRTGKTKKVTKGKHATKGRGVINDQMVKSSQLPAETLRQIANFDGHHLDGDDDDDGVDHEPPSGSGAREEAHDDEDDPIFSFELAPPDRMDPDDAEAKPFTPVYNNELWAESAIRKIRGRKKRVHGAKHVPSFYMRRAESTSAFLLDTAQKTQSRRVLKKLKSNPDDDGQVEHADVTETVESWAKVLTFHPDGTFSWPESSPYLCWNCCQPFSGPPAMIPRELNRVYQYYVVYGNFCTWSCAKRFAHNSENEFNSDTAPCLDHFASKYFGVRQPITMAPPPLLLDTFSEFGMSIEDYRRVGQVHLKDSTTDDYTITHPPCVPYEVLITWQKRKPEKVKIKTGYEKQKKRRFEALMNGSQPLPQMPEAIAENTKTISAVRPGQFVQPAKKRKKKNLLTLLDQ